MDIVFSYPYIACTMRITHSSVLQCPSDLLQENQVMCEEGPEGLWYMNKNHLGCSNLLFPMSYQQNIIAAVSTYMEGFWCFFYIIYISLAMKSPFECHFSWKWGKSLFLACFGHQSKNSIFCGWFHGLNQTFSWS